MKQWEAKFLGFSTPLWLLLQMVIPGYAQNWRVGIGLLVLVVGLFLSLAACQPGEQSPRQWLADSFLCGIGFLIAVPLLIGMCAGVLQLFGVR